MQNVLLRNRCLDIICLCTALSYNTETDQLRLPSKRLIDSNFITKHKHLEPLWQFAKRTAEHRLTRSEMAILAGLALLANSKAIIGRRSPGDECLLQIHRNRWNPCTPSCWQHSTCWWVASRYETRNCWSPYSRIYRAWRVACSNCGLLSVISCYLIPTWRSLAAIPSHQIPHIVVLTSAIWSP